MLRLLQEIQGMQVVTLAEGRVMGVVQKVFLNAERKAVSGLLVRQGGFGGGEGWIETRDVAQIGEDVVFFRRVADCKSKAPVGRSLKDLMGMPVATLDGKIIGSLVDIEVDDGWRVVELSLSEGRTIEIDPRQAVFGQDTILLRPEAVQALRPAARQKIGFLARLFGPESIQEAAGAISRAEQARTQSSKPAGKARRPTKRSPKRSAAGKKKKKTAPPTGE